MSKTLRYFEEEDILYIQTAPGRVHDQTLLDDDILLSYGKKGELVSIEVWHASKRGLAEAIIAASRRAKAKPTPLTEPHSGKRDAPEIEAK